MPVRLDSRLAEKIVESATGGLYLTPGNKVLCTKDALRQAILAAVVEAHEIGFLSGQREQYAELTRPGSPDRPAWMDIRLDNAEDLANHHIRFKPVALKSLIEAGYRCLGDLRWVSNRELTGLHYIGYKTARQILAVVRRFERDSEAMPVVNP